MAGVEGTWGLIRATAATGDGTALPLPYGGKPMGRLLLTADGQMTAVTCNGLPSVPLGDGRDYNAYCGNYTTDGKTLTTRVFAASDPSRLGGDQVRGVRFAGKYMVLRPPFRSHGGKPPEQRELWWERLDGTMSSASSNPPSIVGTWGLARGTCTAANGEVRPAPYGGAAGQGRVAFLPEGQMMAVLCDCRKDMPDGMAREFNSYCGNTTFDGAKLTTQVFANSDASRLSADQVRAVRLEGNFMILRPPTRPGPFGPEQREMWFERIAPV
jgi:hypothetical protein